MNFFRGHLMSGTGLKQLVIDGEMCQPGAAKKDHGQQ